MLTEQDLHALRAAVPPMPWTDRTFGGGIIQIVDCKGVEVPLLTALKFLKFVTFKLAPQATAAAPSTATPEKQL